VTVVKKLKQDNDLYLPLFYFIFDKEIAKFQATKRMTKGVKEKADFDDEEEAEDEFSENSDNEAVSSKSLASDEDEKSYPVKPSVPSKDSKQILEELEKSDSGESLLSQDSAEAMRKV